MKFLFAIILALTANIANAKTALLMTHYGSSDTATIARTLSPLTAEITADHPDLIVTEAYISPVVRCNLARLGIDKPSPVEALMRLKLDGVDTVFIQSSTIIDGAEMQSVRDDAAGMSKYFNRVAIGEPLLYNPDDFQCLANTIIGLTPIADKDTMTIYVGHGNQLPSTAAYALLDHTIHASGRPDIHVSTIEGAPTAEATAALLSSGLKHITLVPLLLVAGNHTRRDIDGEFRSTIQQSVPRATVTTTIRGLAENPEIRLLYRAKVNKLIER